MPNEASKALLADPIYRASELVNLQVMKLLAGVKTDDLLAYADTLDYNHSLRDDDPVATRHDITGVITRCLTLHSDVCHTAEEVVEEFNTWMQID